MLDLSTIKKRYGLCRTGRPNGLSYYHRQSQLIIHCIQHLTIHATIQRFQEQSTISKLLSEMTPEQKDHYNELETTAAALREEVEAGRTQLEFLNKERTEFATEISGSQVSAWKILQSSVREQRQSMRASRLQILEGVGSSYLPNNRKPMRKNGYRVEAKRRLCWYVIAYHTPHFTWPANLMIE